MFTPSRFEARKFFFDVWGKYRRGEPMAGMQALVLEAILRHPEYHGILDDPDRFLDQDYLPEFGETNPFLHLGMHIALAEQLSIDQPSGIRAEYDRIQRKIGDAHSALHEMMECLAEMLWQAQRSGAAPDAKDYLACLKRR